ncbi:MAG: aminotransferase class I/II-fold pyridoxal phosphate-dependent enzyme, partial [Candidatus Limnocylindria bacterium]
MWPKLLPSGDHSRSAAERSPPASGTIAAVRFPEFAMERMQSTWEHRVRHDLSESGVEPLTLAELLEGDLARLGEIPLGYAAGTGRDATRALIARFHRGASLDTVLVTTGTSEANLLALATLVEPGDEVVVVLPNYMQVHGLARGLGAIVREVWLREESGWRCDLDALRAATSQRTRVICVCTPNNPTAQALAEADVAEVVRVADRSGAWILADEVYRGAERDGVESPSFAGRGERVLVTGGLSKAYGLPGLRIGWIVGPRERIEAAWAMKDYTTIAAATLSECVAELALARRDALLARTRRLLNERWPVLEAWAVARRDALSW